MKNKITVLLLFSLLAFAAGIQAQDTRWDTIPGLIISEVRLNGSDIAYIELANVDDVAINLKGFKIATSSDYKSEPRGFAYLPDKVLEPGETFVVAMVHDWGDMLYDNQAVGYGDYVRRTMPEVIGYVDLPVFRAETNPKDPADSASGPPMMKDASHEILSLTTDERNVILEYKEGNDSVFVDLCNATATGNVSTFVQHVGYVDETTSAIAGVPRVWGAVYMSGAGHWPGAPEYTIVRKTTVTHGTVIWDNSRGTDADNSEWIVVPAAANERLYGWEWSKYFTTMGRHGNGTLNETTVTSSVVDIDWVNHKISVPWGIRRFNIMDYITVGDNITWQYVQNNVSEDSLHIGVCTGDKLVMYATGASLQEVEFDIEVGDPNDQTAALVLPLLVLPDFDRVFEVTNNAPGMDSIMGMDYGLRVDTLYKYIEKAEGATWKLICVDGLPDRADLKRGDLLRVTNGSVTKDYYLAVSNVPIVSNNAFLGAINWPDIPETVLNNAPWNGKDLIPNFNYLINEYIVKLPLGTVDVPALTATGQDMNSTITIEPAATLNGVSEDRTTKITVVSENGANTLVYYVRFDLETSSGNIQPLTGDPLFTRFLGTMTTSDNMLEISNPGTTSIDLSNYMLVMAQGGTAPDQVIRNNTYYGHRYFWYIFGYDYGTDAEWNAGKQMIVHPDYRVNTILGGGKSFAVRGAGDGWWYWAYMGNQASSDMNLNPGIDLTFCHNYQKSQIEADRAFFKAENMVLIRAGDDWWTPVAQTRDKQINFLFKIVGDSIKEGWKPIGDPADFQLIDMMGTYDNTSWEPVTDLGPGLPVPGRTFWNWNYLSWSIVRKPEIRKGDPNPGGSWGSAETSEWLLTNALDLQDRGITQYTSWLTGMGVGTHIFAPANEDASGSTILSHVYAVSGGYSSPQTIKGVITGTTVEDFIANIIKRNPDQTLEVVGKSNSDVVVTDDVLKVTSGDGKANTEYKLTVADVGLSSDATLVARAGSNLIVEVEGNAGTVSGVKFGTTLDELLFNLIKPAKATLKVVNASGNLIPKKGTNVGDNLSLVVTSENSENTITYSLVIEEFTDNSAYLYSNVYDVDQIVNLVSGITIGVKVPTLLSNLFTNEGATIIVVDKTGSERTAGDVAVDDNLIVTSPDGTVTKVFWLAFVGERQGTDAYVTSDVLVVDQMDMIISGIPRNTSLNIFLGLVNPAPFSTLTVLNAEGAAVTSGNIGEGYKLQVTSGDHTKSVQYDLSLLVTVPNTEFELVRIYPNPATDYITIEGLRANCTVTITNIIGSKVKVLDSKNIHNAMISVEDLPAGIYLITITAENYKSQPVRLLVE